MKNPCRDPLKAREKEVDVIHAMIHEIKVVGNCRAASMSLINAQSTVSKAFLKSIFKVHLRDVLFLLYCLRSSCRRKILSSMALFWMNVAWTRSMILDRARASLEAMIF